MALKKYEVQAGFKGWNDHWVMTATRGPDNNNHKLKMFTTGVIRFWIQDWGYGDTCPLNFIVLPAYDSLRKGNKVEHHFRTHVELAARAIGLPTRVVSEEVWNSLPFYYRYDPQTESDYNDLIDNLTSASKESTDA